MVLNFFSHKLILQRNLKDVSLETQFLSLASSYKKEADSPEIRVL